MNLFTGYKDIHKSVGRDEPRPWRGAHFAAPKQIASVKGMNQKGMNLEIVNSKNYKDIFN